MFTVYLVLSLQILTMAICIASIFYCHKMHSMVKDIIAKYPIDEENAAVEEADTSEETVNQSIANAHTVIDKKDILDTEDEVQKEAYLAMIANVEEKEVEEMSHRDMLMLQLRTLIEQEKIYLKAGLKLDEVAMTLGTNRTYVARMMMEMYHHTFTEQMNIFRLQSAKEDLLHRRNASIEDIALSNGFNSSNTFNKVFNQHFNCSPATWRNEH